LSDHNKDQKWKYLKYRGWIKKLHESERHPKTYI